MPNPKTTYLKCYTPPTHLVSHIFLDIRIDSDKTTVRCVQQIKYNPLCSNSQNKIILNGIDLNLISISIDSKPLNSDEYKCASDSLTIFEVPKSFTLETLVKIDPQSNFTLSGLYVSSDGYFTQCEAQGFRRITYYLDRPDVMSKFTTRITADRKRFPVLLSNGNLTSKGKDNNKHWAEWDDPFPKPSYLFAMVAADLDILEDQVKTKSGRMVKLNIYAQHKKIPQCLFAMECLKKAIKWDEDNFDLEIDLEQYSIVAVDDFNMGAMENKGLNIFNSKYILAKPELSTDLDYMFIDRVIAHEYFHNWTGNRVTCRDWFQLSLKEGLTVFRDQEYGADMYSRATQRIQEVRNLRNVQFPEDASAMAHAVRPESYEEINNFYTATVYEKGAEIVRMINTLIGSKKFKKGMKIYFDRHDGTAATTDDFVQAMQDASSIDLTQFKLWYDRPGTPRVKVDSKYEKKSKTYHLWITQELKCYDFSHEKAMHIPIKLGLISQEGNDMMTTIGESQAKSSSHTISLTNQKEYFNFKAVNEEPVLSIFREFSAPVILTNQQDPMALTHQLSYDSDDFNRWEASQILFCEVILKNVKAIQSKEKPKYPTFLLDAILKLLNNRDIDQAFLAEVLSLPSDHFLAEKLEIVDPESLYLSRVDLLRNIAGHCKTRLINLYKENVTNSPYSPDAHSSGRRALKNVTLRYLMELNDEEAKNWCKKQFNSSDNMTDTISSLSLICDLDPESENWALNQFYNKWKSEPSVIDKWFSIQAGTRSPDTLDKVRSLTTHEAFDYTNPNKVYSLIRRFGSNHRQFHAADGSGYEFMAKQILHMDKINPQVAARLSRTFDRCPRFDKDRWRIAQSVLRKINATTSLSNDTKEIVSKTLYRSS